MRKYFLGLFLMLLLFININVKAIEKTNVYFSISWSDNANTTNQRPSSVTVDLMNGDTIVNTMEVSASNEWKGVFSNVDKYDSNNSRIAYKVREHDINDYNISIYQGETIDGYSYPDNISNIEINTDTNTSSIIDVPGTNGWKIQKGLQHDLIPGTHVVFNLEQFSLSNATLKEYDADGNEVTKASQKKFHTSDSCQVEGERYRCVLLNDNHDIPLNTLYEVDHYITLTFHDAATVIEGPYMGTTHDVILTAKNIKTYKVNEKGLKIFQDGPFIGPSNVYYNTGANSIDVNIKVDGVTTGSVLMSFYDIDITENLGGDEYPWVESIILLNGFEKTVYTTTLDGELSTIFTKFEETDEGYFRAYAENENPDENKTMRSGFVAMANLSENGLDIRWQGSTCSTKLFGDVSSFKLKTTINGVLSENLGGTISELSDWKSRNYGEPKVVTIIPNHGYHIMDLKIDGNLVNLNNFDANGYMELTTGYTLNGNTGTEVIKLYQRANGKIDVYLPAQYFSDGQDTIPERVDHWIDVSFEDNSCDSFSIINTLSTIPGICPNPNDDENVWFEGVGHYAFATAGNNNAERSDGHVSAGSKWILSTPDTIEESVAVEHPINYNWETVKNKIAQKDGITSFTNMSGSYLDYSGTIKYALISYFNVLDVNPDIDPTPFRILIIAPDGEYKIINREYPVRWGVNGVERLNITDFVSEHGSGWYFVSFLDAILKPHNAWNMTAVYENESLELSYIKLMRFVANIHNGEDRSIEFKSNYRLTGEFQLIGAVFGAGVSAWPKPGETEDRVFALLEDGTEYQLYDRGDGHFTGRTNTDFLNDIFSTIRSVSIQGGEMDLFDETLDTSYFGGKEPIGYRFIKDGTNGLEVQYVGLRKTVENPNVSIVTDIEDQNLFGPGDDVNVTTTILNKENDNNVCAIIYDNKITSKVDYNLENIRNIVVTYDGNNYIGVYNATTGKIEVEQISEIDCHKPVVLTYTGTIKDNIQVNDNNKYRIEAESFLNYALVHCDPFTQTISDDDFIESPIPVKVITHHYLEGTETKVHDDVIQNLFYGDPYSTTYIPSPNLYTEYANRYAFNNHTDGDLVSGIINGDPKKPIEVIYYYEKVVEPIVGTKTWIDGGREHDNSVDLTITLYRNGVALDLVPTWDGNTYSFGELDMYDNSHNKYRYTVSEKINDNVPDHDKYIPTQNDFDFINKLVDDNHSIDGTKTWIDGSITHNNPSEIKLHLYRESEKVAKEEVDATPIWNENRYTYYNLPKYDSYGYPYTYSVVEETIDGYDTTQNGFDFINKMKQDEVTIIGHKTWIDGGRTHNNPSEIKLHLYRESEKVAKEEVNVTPIWEGNTYRYVGLDKYDSYGYPYTYSVIEEAIDGYDTTQNGFDFTNKIKQEEFIVNGTKTWIDGNISHNNSSEIKLHLYRESKKVAKEEVNVTPIWEDNKYRYLGLDKYDSYGYPYTYSVVEEHIDGYDTYYDGLNITNVSQVLANVIVTKEWDDKEYQDSNGNQIEGYKRQNVVIKLYANGTIIDDCILTEDNKWTCKFENLRAYNKNGKINYSATEETLEGFVLESINKVEEVSVDGTITYKITIKNKPVDKKDDFEPIILKILKVDKDNYKPLQGAIFRLEKDGIKKEYKTDSEGYINIEFMEEGIYTLEEILAPDGYKINTKKYTIVVKKELIKVDLSNDNSTWEWKYKLVFDEETKGMLENNILKVKNEKEDIPPTGDKIHLYIIALVISMINISLIPSVIKCLKEEG